MSLFSIKRNPHSVLHLLSLCLSILLGQTHTEGPLCFWRARNPITFETTSVAPNNSPAGCLIALTTGTDTEVTSHSTVCVAETFPLGLKNMFCTAPCSSYDAFTGSCRLQMISIHIL